MARVVSKKPFVRRVKGKRQVVGSHSQTYHTGRDHPLSRGNTPVSGKKNEKRKQRTFWKKGHPVNPSWFTGRFNSTQVTPRKTWNVTNFKRSGDGTGVISERHGRIVGRTKK